MRKYKFAFNLALFVVVLCPLFAINGCKKILDIHSAHAVNESNFWNSRLDSRAALMGVYGLMRVALANNEAYWMYGELRGGDFRSYARADLSAIIGNRLNESFDLLNQLSDWREFYAVVNAANLFLENVDRVSSRDEKYTDQNKRVDIAQIRFLRALAYFYVCRIWGDAPLITTSHDNSFENKGVTDQETILAFVDDELKNAAEDLPYIYSLDDPQQEGDYYNEEASVWNGVLATKLDAYAIRAHVAAWQGNYTEVAAHTDFVLNNFDRASLQLISTDDLTESDGFFAGKNTNHMIAFDFSWENHEASYSGHIENLTLAQPLVEKNNPDVYITKDTILSLFDKVNDERFSFDTLTGDPINDFYFTNFSNNVPLFSKIKVIRGGDDNDPNLRIFGSSIVLTRLEDLALLRAEALVFLGNSIPEAIDLLNQIRDLRGLEHSHYNEVEDGALIDAIFKERRKELMGEGHRWYDFVRYNKIKRNNLEFLDWIDQGGIYWPISKDILSGNPEIRQNEFWK